MTCAPFSKGFGSAPPPPLFLAFGKLFPALLAAFPSGNPPHSFGRNVCLRTPRSLIVQDLVHHLPPSKVPVLSARSQKSVGDLTAPSRSLMVSPTSKGERFVVQSINRPAATPPTLRVLLNQSQGSRFDLDQSWSLTLCGLPISNGCQPPGQVPMLHPCSSSPRPMLLRSVLSTSRAATCRPRSSCGGGGITDNAQARECARTIAGWKPLRPVKRMPKPPRLRRVR